MEKLDGKINAWLRDHLIPWLGGNIRPVRCSSWDEVECTVTRPRGSFFLSDLFFANIRFPGEERSWCCLVKVPSQDPRVRSFQDFPHLFQNEIMFYERLASGSTEYPKYYFGRKDPVFAYVIVLENVCSRGFFTKPKKINIELDYVIAGLTAIAKYHGNTYAMKEKSPDKFDQIVKDIYNVRYSEKSVNKIYKQSVDGRIKRVTKTLTARNYDSDFTKKIADIFDECFSKVLMRCVKPCEPLATIVHGDCTINNILFRKVENSQDLEAMLVDFAMLMYSSPATDVSTFIYMSCSRENIREHHADLFKAYHNSLTDSLKERGIWKPTKYSYDAFWNDYKERAFFGYVIGAFFLPMMNEYDKNNDILQLDNDTIEAANSIGGGEALSQQLVDMLIDMREAGLLDSFT